MRSWVLAFLLGSACLTAFSEEWLAGQEDRLESYLSDTEGAGLRERLEEIHAHWQVEMPIPSEEGLYFIARAPGEEQGKLWKLGEEPDLVLDPEESSLSLARVVPSPDGSQLAYGLRLWGSDWETWHIEEDRLEWIKFGHICWAADGEGLYYLRLPTPTPGEELTAPNGRGGMIYYHQLGTPQAADERLYAGRAIGALSPAPGGEGLWIWTNGGDWSSTGILYLNSESGEVIEVMAPTTDHYEFLGEGLVLTDRFSPLGTIATYSDRMENLSPLIQLDEVIVEASVVGNHLVVSSLLDVVPHLRVFDLEGNLEREIALPEGGMVSAGWRGMHLVGASEEEFFFAFTDLSTPNQIYRCEVETGEYTFFAVRDLSWDPADFETEQVWFTSSDGAQVPVFVGRKKGTPDSAPTLLYGYGGFGLEMGPFFDPMHLAWMEEGGIVAIACLRGGGELGSEWRHAGRGEKKQQVFDDFIAAAEYFSARAPVAIYGRSNGGLVVGAAVTQRPDLFDAAVIGVGVLDMLDFHRWTDGESWEFEFGSPEDPEARKWLQAYSPLHNVRADLPPTLLLTGLHDDRVVPLHSYKFTDAVQEVGVAALLYVGEYGHSNTSHRATSARVDEESAILAFLKRELGL